MLKERTDIYLCTHYSTAVNSRYKNHIKYCLHYRFIILQHKLTTKIESFLSIAFKSFRSYDRL